MNTASNEQSSQNERHFKVSLGGEEKVLPESQVMAYAGELNAKFGGVPDINPVDAPKAEVKGDGPTVTLTSVQPVKAPVREGEIDHDAKKRIDGLQDQLRAAGVKGVGFKGEGGDGDQFYANGTRMMTMGYDTQHARKAEHENAMSIDDAGAGLAAIVKAENREDVEMSAREFANSIEVNGKITVKGKTLTEQAIRGLMAQTGSPALSYVLGLRTRIADEMAKPESSEDEDVELRDVAALRGDRAKIADVLRHEALRHGDTALKLRTRGNPNDIFAVVSPKYAPADAPEVLAQILGGMPKGSKGTWTYHPHSTQWELRASVWTPTPVEQQAVGEPFAGYVSFRARDNGTSKFRGGGGIEILRCLNASVYVAESNEVDRVHRGRILYDIAAMMKGALKAIDILCAAWGTNRDIEVPLPMGEQDKPVPISVAIPGFWRFLLTDRRSELQGVLPGRTEKHVAKLSELFFQERRVEDKVVRSDFGQAYTRYIQEQPIPVRRDAETSIAKWLMSSRTDMRLELRDK